ncbi:MAG TPA: lipopolysaccharide heptosyltransferase II [Planctomycetota bacterium]|nr:lipopolysaccharide heptosyltransferase II [Planctomycetota bacterium]HQB00960.1 lipopolysaccharide heptosyltransferase II [Planctomycetota bacterium]
MQKTPKKILVRLPNWVGDVVMATPVIETLHYAYPEAKIYTLVRPYAQNILHGNPWITNIIPCDDKTYQGWKAFHTTVRKIQPDLTILLTNSMRSLLFLRLAGIKNIYGYKRDARSFLLTGGPSPIKAEKKYLPIPMVDYYLGICKYLQIPIHTPIKPTLHITPETQKKADELLKKYNIQASDTVIGLNPGAKFGASKCWPPHYFAQLANLLQRNHDVKILLFTGPGEEELAQNILDNTEATIIPTYPDNPGLDVLKPLIKRCNLLVTNDTGTRHYAVALDTPLVVIFGPTDQRYTNNNLEKTTIIDNHLPCAPCHLKKCPTDHKCMLSITPEQVYEACKLYIKK